VTTFGVMAAFCAALMAFRRDWVTIFSPDADVVDVAARVMPLTLLVAMLDSVQCVLSAILRGCGRQRAGAVANFVSYYVIALPCAIVICFKVGGGVEEALHKYIR
jgi:multidrug resistance protein, MATE family